MKNILILLCSLSSITLFAQYEIEYLSEARGNLSTAIFGDSILFVGGSDSDKVDYMNINDFSITTGSYGNDGFKGSKVVQNENYAVFYDLLSVNLSSNQMYVYDYINDIWFDDKYPGGASQEFEDAFFDGDKLIFIDDNYNSSFREYNIANQSWTSLPSPFSRRDCAIIDTGDKVFFMGGKESFTVRSNQVDVYIKSTQQWDNFTLHEAKNACTPVKYEDKIVLAGGQKSNVGSNVSVDLVEIIDINTYAIDTLRLTKKRNNYFGLVSHNKVIFAGGNSEGAEIINMDDYTVEYHNLNITSITKYLSGGCVGDTCVFMGASALLGEGDLMHIYNSFTNSWSNINIGGIRVNVAPQAVGNKLFMAGGELDTNTTYDEIYVFEDLTPHNTTIDTLITTNPENFTSTCAINSITTSGNVTIINGNEVTFQAGGFILLDTGFCCEQNAIFSVIIDSCSSPVNSNSNQD